MNEWKKSQYPVPYPLVVVVSGERPNPSTYIFFGQFNEHPPIIAIGTKEKRYTYKIIKEIGDFTVNFVSASILKGADASGIVSGRRADKSDFFIWEPSLKIKSPRIKKSPFSLEVVYLQEIKFTDHIMIIGEVKKAWAREGVEPQDFILSSYSSMQYFSLGEALGNWGFSKGKP